MKIAYGLVNRPRQGPWVDKLGRWVLRTCREWRPIKLQITALHAHRSSKQFWIASHSLKGNDPAICIWSHQYIQENHKSLLAFYIHYLIIFTTSCVWIVPILQEKMTFWSPPSSLMWYFPPSAPAAPHLGDTLEPSHTQDWTQAFCWIRFSLGHRRNDPWPSRICSG